MPPELVAVRYEVAEDEGFKSIVDQGQAWAEPMFAHSVHVETTKLAPGRGYWYRFHAADATSPIGRTRTAPPVNQTPDKFRFAFASCQQYEQGHYGAYRNMAKEDLDLVIHLGDYIYESSWGDNKVRSHGAPEPITLDDYRSRYALYKSDPDLQAAHAAFPWAAVWDDHEVENDYADDHSENADDPRWFIQRRAAAYQAWYEHMPARRFMAPFGAFARIYTQLRFGQLAEINLLDDRQFRSPQPCPKPGRGGSNFVENCSARLDPRATLLGERQEAWLAAKLASSKARWNVLAQQTLMAQADRMVGEGQQFYTDGWDGYPAARERLMDTLVSTKVANPIVIGGDVHSFWVADLKRDFNRPDSPTLSTEFCGTSITSAPPPEEIIQAAKSEGPHIKFATGAYRGYSVMTLTGQSLKADLRAVQNHRDPDTKVSTIASFVVTEGKPGAERSS
jgi:alkaline phosphatase D